MNHWLKRLAWLENSLLVILLTVLVSLAGLQILLRNVWDSGLSWGDPMLRVTVLWVGLLGALVATRDDKHIRIDLLSRYLPPRLQTISHLVTELFSAAICALLAYHGARFAYFDWEANITAFATVPAWVCETILPLGFGLMALRFLLSALSGQTRSQPPP